MGVASLMLVLNTLPKFELVARGGVELPTCGFSGQKRTYIYHKV